MTQTPQGAPAGWYPSPDGAPVLRWWDGALWTDATHPTAGPVAASAGPVSEELVPEELPVSAGPAASGWPAPQPPRLDGLSRAVAALVGVAAVAWLAAAGVRAWALGDEPAWLTPGLEQGVAWFALGAQAVAAVVWLAWQSRVARAFPPGTPRRTPGWQALSWLVPVGNLWLPYQNVADLFRLATGRNPRWLAVWWVLSLVAAATTLAGVVWTLADPATGPWLAVAGGVLLLASASLSWLVTRRLSRAVSGAIAGRREQPAG